MENVPTIKITPPGPRAKEIIERDHKLLATSTKTAPIAAKCAKGLLVEDVDGNTYYDFATGVSVLNVGHCHPKIVEAVRKQAGELMHFAGTDYYYDIQVRLAQKLTEITPGKFQKKVFFTNSGAESVECAIKIAKWSTMRKQFVAFIGAFHGRTTGAQALTGSKPVHKNRFFPTMPGVTHIPYANCYRCAYHLKYPECDIWCAKILDEIYFNTILPPEEVAAMFVEPVQGEGGYIVPPKEFIAELKKIAEKHGILYVDDEVQAGFGRTGKMFAVEHHGVVPDIITMAKSLGSGIPIGATVFDAKYDFKVQGAHSNTYGGNLVACASALATIDVLENEKMVNNSKVVGEYMKKRLLELQERHEKIGDVRGLGLMLATELVENRKTKKPASEYRDKVIENCYKQGLLVLPCGKSSVRYLPPLNVTKEQVDIAINIVDKSLKTSL
ncbi:MAG: acetyl ornithine aminotransferase family protein [Thermoplasmata archaeon]